MPVFRIMQFELEPLPLDDPDRKELTCLWCRFRNCDYTFTLRGAVRGSSGTQVLGVHNDCLTKHEEVVERARLAKGFLEEDGIRDPEYPCAEFKKGQSDWSSSCMSDGHYLCKDCSNFRPDES